VFSVVHRSNAQSPNRPTDQPFGVGPDPTRSIHSRASHPSTPFVVVVVVVVVVARPILISRITQTPAFSSSSSSSASHPSFIAHPSGDTDYYPSSFTTHTRPTAYSSTLARNKRVEDYTHRRHRWVRALPCVTTDDARQTDDRRIASRISHVPLLLRTALRRKLPREVRANLDRC
jgi:hypothetical protein